MSSTLISSYLQHALQWICFFNCLAQIAFEGKQRPSKTINKLKLLFQSEDGKMRRNEDYQSSVLF